MKLYQLLNEAWADKIYPLLDKWKQDNYTLRDVREELANLFNVALVINHSYTTIPGYILSADVRGRPDPHYHNRYVMTINVPPTVNWDSYTTDLINFDEIIAHELAHAKQLSHRGFDHFPQYGGADRRQNVSLKSSDYVLHPMERTAHSLDLASALTRLNIPLEQFLTQVDHIFQQLKNDKLPLEKAEQYASSILYDKLIPDKDSEYLQKKGLLVSEGYVVTALARLAFIKLVGTKYKELGYLPKLNAFIKQVRKSFPKVKGYHQKYPNMAPYEMERIYQQQQRYSKLLDTAIAMFGRNESAAQYAYEDLLDTL